MFKFDDIFDDNQKMSQNKPLKVEYLIYLLDYTIIYVF